MSNYTKTSEFKQNRNQSEFFVGSQSPYLTRTNNSHSHPYKFIENIEEESQKLALDFDFSTAESFNNAIKSGSVRMKKINDSEFHIYKVPNRSGKSGLHNSSAPSFSTNARFTARNRLIETIKANTDFCYFFTGTFDPKKWDRTNFAKLHSSLTHWLRRRGIKYILVPEPHKDGSIHFHGLFNSTIEPYLAEFDFTKRLPKKITDGIKQDREIMNCPDYAKMFGWVSIEKVRNLEACAVYVAKYVSKTFDDSQKRFSYRRYFCSTNLKRPEFVLKSEKSYSGFTKRFSSIIPKVVYRRSAVPGAVPLAEAPPSAPEGSRFPTAPIFSGGAQSAH